MKHVYVITYKGAVSCIDIIFRNHLYTGVKVFGCAAFTDKNTKSRSQLAESLLLICAFVV